MVAPLSNYSAGANNIGLPQNNVPFIDMQTGRISREWWPFMQNLYNRIGGANALTNIELGQLTNRASPVVTIGGDVDADDQLTIPGPPGIQGQTGLPGPDLNLMADDLFDDPLTAAISMSNGNAQQLQGQTWLTNNGIGGTTTNNNADPGKVGEYIASSLGSGYSVALTNNVAATVTSIFLTAGDWDVSASCDFTVTAGTVTALYGGITNIPGTLIGQPGNAVVSADPTAYFPPLIVTTSAQYGLCTKSVRVTLSAATSIYLVANALFSAGTVSAYGTISARRMR